MRARAARIPVFLVTALLGACAVDEHKEVRTYRDVLEKGAPPAADAGVDAPRLTVIDTMRLVNARYEPLSIAGEDYLQSLIEIRRAVAAFLPTISLAPSYQWDEKTPGRSPTALNTPVDAQMNVNVVRDLAEVRRTQATAGQDRALLLDLQDIVLLDAARAHYEVIRAERAVEVIQNSLQVQQQRVDDARGRYEAGVVRPVDVSLTESQASQTAVDLVVARNAVVTTRATLSFLTDVRMGQREIVDELAMPEEEPGDLDALWRIAEANRQDVLAAQRRIEAAQQGVESAYGEYYPSISVDVQAFLQRDTEPTALDFATLFRISLPLFSAGLIEADVRTALSDLRQAKLGETLARRAARRDVEIALQNLVGAGERRQQLDLQVRFAQEALDQSEGLYQVGLGTNLERLAAQDRLLAAQLQLVNAEFDRKVFYLDLLRATGRLHELLGLVRDQDPPPASAGAKGGS